MSKMAQISRTVMLFGTVLVTLSAKAHLIGVTSPPYRSDVRGNATIRVHALGYQSPLTAKRWLPGGTDGSDSTIARVTLDRNGDGSFSFPTDLYPHGPIAVRITGARASDGPVDTCYLQIYNTGGISWHESIPSAATPAAGMFWSFRMISTGRFPYPAVA